MKYLLLGAATLALVGAAHLSPAAAQGPKPSDDNGPGIPAAVYTEPSNPLKATPRYEYLYGYARHGRWRGHWVLVQ